MPSRRRSVLIGAGVVGVALAALVYSGLKESVVYFYTPSELMEKGEAASEQPVRLGGVVQEGSLIWVPETLYLSFRLTDGRTAVPVVHEGAPPDLFGEGRGAVIEGRLTADGTFHANTILAKHAEEYRPPRPGEEKVDLYETLIREGQE